MRKSIHSLLLLSFLTVFNGCESEKVIDDVFDGITRGAILRTINATKTYNLEDTSSVFRVQLEESDHEDGTLLSEVNLYISFSDKSETEKDLEVEEFFMDTFTTSSFGLSENGLPLLDVSVSLKEAIEATKLKEGEFVEGDQFIFRFELVLTDGRTFSSGNANSTVTGGSFFRSPFRYAVTLTLPSPPSESINYNR
ncbi:hypothetical protein GWK08_16990 [Leptobacterium flavescens]|uniref:Uncharacterized protein n=1 Tax=Leptobacterium flavescens TaxID=472055 RepID=A0A6P0UP93_9FLAO|nr:hypothetical protein [Leptobacterium flavescens]NER15154.1 hypothetical protein [Leptobacterium flavescens]